VRERPEHPELVTRRERGVAQKRAARLHRWSEYVHGS
jgi:hypothetical protein